MSLTDYLDTQRSLRSARSVLELLGQILVVLLLLVGSFFLLVGSYGLAKLPSLMQRLHAPTKSSTLGLGGLLLGLLAGSLGLIRLV